MDCVARPPWNSPGKKTGVACQALLEFNCGFFLKHIKLVIFSAVDINEKIFSFLFENAFISLTFWNNSLVVYEKLIYCC